MSELVKMIDGVVIPLTEDEILEHNRMAQEWADQAGERLKASFQTRLEMIIEETAQSKQYSSPASCASYKDSTNPVWAAEANAFIAWRDACYIYAFDYLERAENGEIEPDLDTFLNGIPVISWGD